MDRNTPSPSFQQSSPLESLVRRASSRRARNKQVAALQVPNTPPRQPDANQQWPSPVSPLLHTQFRTSTSTARSAASTSYDNAYYTDSASLAISYDDNADPRISAASIYPPSTRGVSTASNYDLDDITGSYRDSWHSTDTARAPSRPQQNDLPQVVVSVAEPEPSPSVLTPTGRVPSRLPPTFGSGNFSRPVPPPIEGTEERKRQVLARNARGSPGPQSVRSFDQSRSGHSPTPSSPRALSPSFHSQYPVPQAPTSQSSRPTSPYTHQTSPSPSPQPPSPSTSLYSSYSYYPYESAGNSPTEPVAPSPSQPQRQPHPPPNPSASNPQPPKSAAPPNLDNPQTPQEFLQLGIQHHLANRLNESAACFEKSATLAGGCGIGMVMWGLTLRHGWGCESSESKGFKWLRRAAETAVGDLESARAGMDTSAVKSELVLAIYEVGQSFFRGWGVEKDKEMGVSYFRVAARLGDPDAQQELAFCLANGKGCKKDRKEAAKWYRAAVAQGVSDIGLAWIYKEKFQ